MSTTDELAELVHLWSLLDQAVLTEGEDEIRWKWTEDGTYSAKSAYWAQFIGSHCTFNNKVTGPSTSRVEVSDHGPKKKQATEIYRHLK
jgi:hypothetical protein